MVHLLLMALLTADAKPPAPPAVKAPAAAPAPAPVKAPAVVMSADVKALVDRMQSFYEKTQDFTADFRQDYAYKAFKFYRPLDWNAIEVTVQDGIARCTCNGELLEPALKIPEPGQLGLEADKGAIEYRRIRIKALP